MATKNHYGLLPLLLATGIGCAPEASDGQAQSDTSPGGKADLPNDWVIERGNDRGSYGAIAQDYARDGFDVSIDGELLAPLWPLPEQETVVLNRYGTPVLLGTQGYFHTAFDIYRSDTDNSDEIRAPVSGVARVYDWAGEPGYTYQDYATVVAIWDRRSHAIVQLMHIEPIDEIQAGGDVEVEAGDLLGHLVAPEHHYFIEEGHRERLRHTHVNFIDGEHMVALNPAGVLPYHDETPPQVVQVYLLDEAAERESSLTTGTKDVVLEVYDLDRASEHNLEVGSIAYTMTDQDGTVLRESARCDFMDLIDNVDVEYLRTAYDPSPKLLDYQGALAEHIESGAADDRGMADSDIDYPERTFRYALTQFSLGEDGRCQVQEDLDGFVEIADSVQSIRVAGTVWDQTGNASEFDVLIER